MRNSNRGGGPGRRGGGPRSPGRRAGEIKRQQQRRKRILTLPKPFSSPQLIFPSRRKEEGGGQDGWRTEKDMDMFTAVPKI